MSTHNTVSSTNKKTIILAYIPNFKAVLTHCQMNKNPCSNQEINLLFEHGFELENTFKN